MKHLPLVLILALVACKKEPREATFSATCDDCVVEFAGKIYDLNSFRYMPNDPTEKVPETVIESATFEADEVPSMTLRLDSGYAFMSIRSGIETVQRRVMSEQETIELR